MKTLSTLLVASLFLAGCSVNGTPGMAVNLGIGSTIGHHLGLGTSLSIPVTLGNKANTANPSGNNGGINVYEEQIVTYFDAHGQTSDAAVKGGFYRQLIGKRNANEYIVQDYYGDNAKKRTDPMVLDKSQLMDFRAHPNDGTLTIYAYNGAVMQQQVYQQGKLISAKY